MNIDEINNTITELENGDTTFVNCQKLASLYIVREHYCKECDTVDREVRDILPAYKSYCATKSAYQKHLVAPESVQYAMQSVCKEVKDLIFLMYSNSDMEREREMIFECIQSVYESFADR